MVRTGWRYSGAELPAGAIKSLHRSANWQRCSKTPLRWVDAGKPSYVSIPLNLQDISREMGKTDFLEGYTPANQKAKTCYNSGQIFAGGACPSPTVDTSVTCAATTQLPDNNSIICFQRDLPQLKQNTSVPIFVVRWYKLLGRGEQTTLFWCDLVRPGAVVSAEIAVMRAGNSRARDISGEINRNVISGKQGIQGRDAVTPID
ncbi:hypothetical protein RRG08_044302 [Elysia crispata]|uniref:Uncharacterized protein n=1 Tax=Elysia crispata TaxID=231223 RepID=A0AAE1CP43_9GAST|nr:hypothetical protein RRG08_044302 [Elysia crispata]